MKNKNGITLIALIITIIVLLILAGVSIALVMGDNGILNKATKSKSQTIIGDVKDTAEIIRGEYEVENNGLNPTSRYIIEQLISKNKIKEDQVEDYGDDTGIGIIVVEGEHVNISGRTTSANDIVSVHGNFYLKGDGTLYFFDAPTNGEELEVSNENLHDTLVSNNVKKLLDNGLFITNDGKLYQGNTDNLVTDSLDRIVLLGSGYFYYLNKDKSLYQYYIDSHYNENNELVEENITNTKIADNVERIMEIGFGYDSFVWETTDNRIGYSEYINVISYLDDVKYVLPGVNRLNYYIDNNGTLKSFSNANFSIENAEVVDNNFFESTNNIGNAWLSSSSVGFGRFVRSGNKTYVVFLEQEAAPIRLTENGNDINLKWFSNNFVYGFALDTNYVIAEDGTPYRIIIKNNDVEVKNISSWFGNKKIVNMGVDHTIGTAKTEDGLFYTWNDNGHSYTSVSQTDNFEENELATYSNSYDFVISKDSIKSKIEENESLFYDIDTNYCVKADELSSVYYDAQANDGLEHYIQFENKEGKWYYSTSENELPVTE